MNDDKIPEGAKEAFDIIHGIAAKLSAEEDLSERAAKGLDMILHLSEEKEDNLSEDDLNRFFSEEELKEILGD